MKVIVAGETEKMEDRGRQDGGLNDEVTLTM